MAKDKGLRIQTDDSANDVAIKVEHVSKTFKLPHNRQNSLKGSLVNLISGGDRTFEKQEVLKDISFEIKKGEFFGIVGRNGSGKSTLLKMLAGIYKPTKGKITVNGSLTPFIELGVGFNPELTGRENVYLNGALLGFNDKEVDAMYDEIVSFAELERFMDQKLKNYSSGMQVRLAFSIAIRAQGDILLLDEVLAVGDEAFQKKCNDYFVKLKAQRQTIVLVTHDMNNVRKYCSRAMLVDSGKIVDIGDPEKIADTYTGINEGRYFQDVEKRRAEMNKKISITLQDKNGIKIDSFHSHEDVVLSISWDSEDIKGVGVALVKQTGERIFAANTFSDHHKLTHKNKCEYHINLDVNKGFYMFRVRLFGDNTDTTIALVEHAAVFKVTDPTENFDGIINLKHKWV